MKRLTDHTVHLKRPVTPASIGDAIDAKPFELMRHLIALEVFIAPHQQIQDAVVHALGDLIGITFEIDEEGGSSIKRTRPRGPVSPSPLHGHEHLSKLHEE